MPINSVHDLMTALRMGKYTSVGSYPIFYLMSDGETASYDGVRSEVWRVARAIRDRATDGWRVVGCDVNWEDSSLTCCITNQPIESAYGKD